MKILKIILSIIVGIGILVGIMFLVRSLTHVSKGTTEEQQAVYTELSHEFETDWKDISQWDPSLYSEEMKKADDSYTSEEISLDNKEKLIVEINSNALLAIDKTLPQLMKASTWDAAKIDTEMAGIDSIAKCPELANKEEVVRSKFVYKLYHEVKNWAEKTINSSVASYYHGSATSWTNFNSIVSDAESHVSKLKNSKYYNEYLANKFDTSLTDALNHVKGLRSAYYDAVAKSIIAHYPIQDWQAYSNPLEEFQRVQNELNQAANKLKSEDSKAVTIVNEYKSKFNRSKPEVSDR